MIGLKVQLQDEMKELFLTLRSLEISDGAWNKLLSQSSIRLRQVPTNPPSPWCMKELLDYTSQRVINHFKQNFIAEVRSLAQPLCALIVSGSLG